MAHVKKADSYEMWMGITCVLVWDVWIGITCGLDWYHMLNKSLCFCEWVNMTCGFMSDVYWYEMWMCLTWVTTRETNNEWRLSSRYSCETHPHLKHILWDTFSHMSHDSRDQHISHIVLQTNTCLIWHESALYQRMQSCVTPHVSYVTHHVLISIGEHTYKWASLPLWLSHGPCEIVMAHMIGSCVHQHVSYT